MSLRPISQENLVEGYYSADVSAGVNLPADATGWINITDADRVLVKLHYLTTASGLTEFLIISNTAADGSGSDNTVATLTTPANITTADQTAMLEINVSDDVTSGDIYLTSSVNTGAAAPVEVIWVVQYKRDKRGPLTTATETASS